MSLFVKCRCGQSFKAKPELAGKAVRCPVCSATIHVPLPGTPQQPSATPGLTVIDEPTTTNSDPFAGIDLGAAPGNSPDPWLPNSTLPASTFAGGASAVKGKPAGGSKSGRQVVWIVLAVVGGGFVFLCLGCAGLFAVGLRQVHEQSAFEQEVASFGNSPSGTDAASGTAGDTRQTLLEARQGFVTSIVKAGESYGPPDDPQGSDFDLIRYQSRVGPLAAYLTRDPGDGRQHPAIVWITGGDNNSIGDVWSPSDPSNDQSASPFRKAGIVMMFPSQRGGNDNPGLREGFLGEVDDTLAATDYLARLPYVDPDQIYLGGHSTGGTMVMVVAECSDRYKAVFALGPVAIASQYGGDYIYCNPNDQREIALRSPLPWLHCVNSPLYVFEGASRGNWDSIQMMVDVNTNPQIQFFKVPGRDHFSVISPLAEKLAAQIVQGQINITEQTVRGL